VAQKEPAARENPLLLLFVDLGLNENAATDQTAIGIDQICDIPMCPPQFIVITRQFRGGEIDGPRYAAISAVTIAGNA
jgi:hypothetical protein